MHINDFKLERYFAEYEFSTRYLLCASDSETFTIGDILALEPDSAETFYNLPLRYTESQGHPGLREEISRLYNNISSEEIIVFTGAEEGIFILMNVLLQKGDHIIVQFPAYQSLFEVANSIGCEVTRWTGDENNGWDPDTDILKKSIKENTKLIIINQPHNPTGNLMSADKFLEIRDIAEENGIFLFSDEVYRFSEYDSKNRLPAMCDLYDNSASLGVMSKTFGLAGLRIGWIVSKNAEVLDKIASFKDYTTICSSAPAEFLSIIALRHREFFISRNKEIIKNNLCLLDNFFEKYSGLFSWVKPKAGAITFPRINFNMDIDDFCSDLVKNKEVLLLPGTKYDFDNRHFRLGYGRKNMPEALTRLEEYVDENL